MPELAALSSYECSVALIHPSSPLYLTLASLKYFLSLSSIFLSLPYLLLPPRMWSWGCDRCTLTVREALSPGGVWEFCTGNRWARWWRLMVIAAYVKCCKRERQGVAALISSHWFHRSVFKMTIKLTFCVIFKCCFFKLATWQITPVIMWSGMELKSGYILRFTPNIRLCLCLYSSTARLWTWHPVICRLYEKPWFVLTKPTSAE